MLDVITYAKEERFPLDLLKGMTAKPQISLDSVSVAEEQTGVLSSLLGAAKRVHLGAVCACPLMTTRTNYHYPTSILICRDIPCGVAAQPSISIEITTTRQKCLI